MKIVIIGGGGMVGQKLARHLAADGLNGSPVELTLVDMGFPPWENGPNQITGDVSNPAIATKIASLRPDIVFYLAAIVSGEAEVDFDKGYRVNVHATWGVLEALRASHLADPSYRPRVVFTSSIAVFGPPYPDQIGDTFLTAPQTSYGAQKVMGEALVTDYARKGFIEGISLRLPTICVRPGKANMAASSFFSGIIREPLNGQEARLPVPDTVRHWHASPRAAVGFLAKAATLDLSLLGSRPVLNLPGVSCTVAEQIEALRSVAGEEAVARIKPDPDEAVMKIVQGWPRNFAPERALAMGFRAEPDFETIIRTYIEDDMPQI
ncbi:MAG: D-erythronate dehydrogenase [Pseudomonadota bacterium]